MTAVRFDRFVEAALYGPDGFYSAHGQAGTRRGDFLTSVGVGPTFGRFVSRYVESVWDDLGRPDEMFVIEAAAGDGTLCHDIWQALADPLRERLRYVMVELSPRLRDAAWQRVTTGCFPGADTVPVTSLARMPAGRFTGVVLANELLDNLPVRLVERTADGWDEVHVDDGAEVMVPAEDAAAAMADAYAPGAAVGARIALQPRQTAWVRQALGTLERGRVLCLDYTSTTPDLATRGWQEWLRTYRGHERAGSPYEDSGSRDITCEVAVDQLPGPPTTVAQADWLEGLGAGRRRAESLAAWRELAGEGGLDALGHRSVVNEVDTLTDPAGLGAFTVMEWQVG